MNGNKTQIEREKIGIKKGGTFVAKGVGTFQQKKGEKILYNKKNVKTPRPKVWGFKNYPTA